MIASLLVGSVISNVVFTMFMVRKQVLFMIWFYLKFSEIVHANDPQGKMIQYEIIS